jgi:DNA gyrase subunit B
MSRVYPKPILQQLIYMPQLTEDMMKDQNAVAEWVDQLSEAFMDVASGETVYQISLTEDTERHIWLPKVQATAHGLTTDYLFSHSFFNSHDYEAIVELGNILQAMIEEGAFIQRNDKKREVASFEEVIAWLMNEAKRGYQIQRYKGLGEMNPEQLWETTMDPDVRRMLKVTIEDAIAADQIFTTLMGDDVEPRREFIESNALLVSNLDY